MHETSLEISNFGVPHLYTSFSNADNPDLMLRTCIQGMFPGFYSPYCSCYMLNEVTDLYVALVLSIHL